MPIPCRVVLFVLGSSVLLGTLLYLVMFGDVARRTRHLPTDPGDRVCPSNEHAPITITLWMGRLLHSCAVLVIGIGISALFRQRTHQQGICPTGTGPDHPASFRR